MLTGYSRGTHPVDVIASAVQAQTSARSFFRKRREARHSPRLPLRSAAVTRCRAQRRPFVTSASLLHDRPWAATRRWHVASCTLCVACCTLQAGCCTSHVACCTLHVACCALHVACCALHVACCALHVACCTLHVACSTLHVACCTLHVACCTLCVVRCALCVVRCLLHVAGWMLYVACCMLYVACCVPRATCHVACRLVLPHATPRGWQVYPPQIRSSMNGLSSAMGKAGALRVPMNFPSTRD